MKSLTCFLASAALFAMSCPFAVAGGSSKAAAAPLRIVGLVSGFTIGTPISIARRVVHQEKSGTRGIAGETTNPALLIPAGTFWFPFAIFSGVCEGPVYAFRNSYMAEKPFSREQFSLGDTPDYDSTEIMPNSYEK